MAAEPVLLERRTDGVVWLTLNQPDRRNSMTAQLTEAWQRSVDRLRVDAEVRCVVVTGAGSAFCAGGDLSWLAESPNLTVDQLRERMRAFYRSWLSVRELDVPVLAAVNGPAIGAGLCLALAADIRYAGQAARFAAPFVGLGMHPGMAATYLLPEVVGLPVARELLFTGRAVGATEALRLGLVTAVFADSELVGEVSTIASQVAAAAPIAVRLTKAALREGHRLEEALTWEALAQPVTLVTEDLREGVAAQRERRRPRFTGR